MIKHLKTIMKRNRRMRIKEPVKFYMRVLNVTWIFLGASVVLGYALLASDHTIRDFGLSIIAFAAAFKALIQYFIK